MNARAIVLVACLALSVSSAMSADSVNVSWSASADVFYSYSLNRPPDHQRAYTTQPARNAEFGLMLGYIGLAASGPDYRGRVAIQEGWFTRANYTGADSSWRWLQEASAGLRIADGLWLDAGVMFSHIGYESMIGRDNLTLSRSFTADNTPYYSTGVALAWNITDDIAITGLVLNGWQQIVDINNDPAFGSKVLVKTSPDLTLNWSTFIGNEQPRGTAALLRFHNNLWAEWKPNSAWTVVFMGDVCTQETHVDTASIQWGAGITAAYTLTDKIRLATRVEHYSDAENIFIVTPNGLPFQTTAASLGFDYRPNAVVMVRGEIRTMMAKDNVFPSNDGLRSSDTYITLSTSVAFGGTP
ncbi:MAG TPA: porin [Candidatus Didemnitutus sp.]|nr:porin [Candidatus Didemnitutus sp.]